MPAPVALSLAPAVKGVRSAWMKKAAISTAHRAQGIEAKRPVHAPIHRLLGMPADLFPRAEWIHDHGVSLPLHPNLTDREQERIVTAVERLVKLGDLQ